MKRSLLPALAVPIAAVLFFLLKPLTSDEWDIEFDRDLEDGKKRYLDDLADQSPFSSRPNIILILADDLGLTDISLYGGTAVDTPNIDSIGRDGITFGQAYATAPICSPSRAGMLTGRYQNRSGFESQPMNRYALNRLEYWIMDRFVDTSPMNLVEIQGTPSRDQILRQGVSPSEILLSEALTASGYRCDLVGKWHLGYGELQDPTRRGFFSFYGFLEAYSAYADPRRSDIESVEFQEFSERYIWRRGRRGYSSIRWNDAEVDEEEHLTDAFAREAVNRIRESARDETPFFLYLPFSAPHTPFQALEHYTGMFADIEDPRKRVYYALIAQLDDAVGRVLTALEEEGIAENTIVVFSSDNGGATYTGATGNDPLRGGKMSHFEGGLSVPLMIRWTDRFSGGKLDDRPVMLFDLFPTLLAAAGVVPPGDRTIDGIDLLTDADRSARPLFWRSGYNKVVLSEGWKLIVNGKDGRIWLYDIRNDREERNNLASERPDMVEHLNELFTEWERPMADPAWPRVMDYFYNEDGEEYWFAT